MSPVSVDAFWVDKNVLGVELRTTAQNSPSVRAMAAVATLAEIVEMLVEMSMVTVAEMVEMLVEMPMVTVAVLAAVLLLQRPLQLARLRQLTLPLQISKVEGNKEAAGFKSEATKEVNKKTNKKTKSSSDVAPSSPITREAPLKAGHT